ncbi:lipopolysaccharide biosynthesis protein [Enterococcus lactis]|uniref:lipopolysaccharide biosynthesis protein n=1 Tax=Enterococcus lactis TaxID=357441 RepID=UPI0024128DF6|nr:lipopolysaccharide biosynthesis protein [Enterococcus lactis]
MIDYNKIMIITLDKKSVLYSTDAIELGIDVNSYFKKRNMFVKCLNHLDRYINTTFSRIAYGDWKKRLNGIELLILNSHFFSKSVIKYVNKYYPHVRIIIWYSNPVSVDTPIDFFDGLNCEIWSFDKKDVERFYLNYNNQFIDTSSLKVVSHEKKYKSELCFIGIDKGRLTYLTELQTFFKEVGIDSMIYIVDSSRNSSSTYQYEKPLSYQEVINYEGNSKAILDIVQENQTGLSLRPIESIFLGVKLITNNNMVKYQDFYNEQNCFLLTERPLSELKQFLNTPYIPVPDKILEKYTLKNWINNFIRFDSDK